MTSRAKAGIPANLSEASKQDKVIVGVSNGENSGITMRHAPDAHLVVQGWLLIQKMRLLRSLRVLP